MGYIKKCLFLFFICCLLIAKSFLWVKNGKENTQIISGDGLGYYKYLPTTFLEDKPNLNKDSYHFMIEVESNKINKYTIGVSICMAPFFALGHISAILLDYPPNGFSFPYQIAISLAGIFYLIMGLWFLAKLLAFLSFSKSQITVTLFLMLFGTNLLTMGVLNPAMSHIYSFFCITALLYLFSLYLLNKSSLDLILASLLFGMLVLIRPSNGIVLLFIPFLVFEFNPKFSNKSFLKMLPISLSAVSLVLSLQLLVWYFLSGKAILWTYQNEGFNFSNPNIFEVLFGFRKGWFIYTPLALISLVGLLSIIKKKKQFVSISLFLIALVYITASWWNWFYANSFALRPMVDFYAIIGILMAYSLPILDRYKIVSLPILAFCISLNLVQNYQYSKGILSSWDMTYDKYKAIFFELEENKVLLGGNRDILPYNAKKELLFDESLDFKTESFVVQYDSVSFSTVASYNQLEYNVNLNKKLTKQAISAKGLYLEIELSRFEKELKSSEKAQLIIDLKDSLLQSHYYYWFYLNETPSRELGWKKYKYQVLLPSAKTSSDELAVFIRNQEKKSFLIETFKVKLSALN